MVVHVLSEFNTFRGSLKAFSFDYLGGGACFLNRFSLRDLDVLNRSHHDRLGLRSRRDQLLFLFFLCVEDGRVLVHL